MQKPKRNTSWQNVAKWYDQTVGQGGHYYHDHVVIPGVLKLLGLDKSAKLVDLGCGQGVLARRIPQIAEYVGVDLATDLIASAKKQVPRNIPAQFRVGDITKSLDLPTQHFTHATVILALQNVDQPSAVFANANKLLTPGGKLVIVLNHPAFRIPRLTGWGVDDQNKQQFRKVYRYMSEQKVPITMNPGTRGHQQVTWSFHQPLSAYVQALKQHGFVITDLAEWCSDKESEGKAAKMENRSREEIPLFMAIVAKKQA